LPNNATWWLYLLGCKGGGIYVGIAKDVEARFKAHQAGEGALYTKLNRPLAILASTKVGSHKQAMSIERKVKKLSPSEKVLWARIVESGADIKELCSSFGFSNINNSGNSL